MIQTETQCSFSYTTELSFFSLNLKEFLERVSILRHQVDINKDIHRGRYRPAQSGDVYSNHSNVSIDRVKAVESREDLTNQIKRDIRGHAGDVDGTDSENRSRHCFFSRRDFLQLFFRHGSPELRALLQLDHQECSPNRDENEANESRDGNGKQE